MDSGRVRNVWVQEAVCFVLYHLIQSKVLGTRERTLIEVVATRDDSGLRGGKCCSISLNNFALQDATLKRHVSH